MVKISDEYVGDPEQPLCIVHHSRVKPECVDAYREYVLEHYVKRANGEPGCELYDVWQDNTDPCHFVTVERWTSVAHLEAHMEHDYVLAGLEKAYAMLEGGMESSYLSSLLAADA